MFITVCISPIAIGLQKSKRTTAAPTNVYIKHINYDPFDPVPGRTFVTQYSVFYKHANPPGWVT
jgi:hypothetical protein